MATNNNDGQDTKRQVNGILEKVAIGALSLVMMYQYNSLEKLEARMYEMQGDSFSQKDAVVMEDRIIKRVESAVADINNKMDTMLWYMTGGKGVNKP